MESTAMGLVRGLVIVAFVLGLPALALFGVPEDVRVFLDSDMLPWNDATPAMSTADEQAGAELTSTTNAGDASFDNGAPREPSFFARTDSIHADHESEAGDDAAGRVALASAEARVLHRPVFRPQDSSAGAEIVRHLQAADMTSEAEVVAKIEARLRALGALNYQLQRDAGSGRFRFICKCANQRREEQVFEATSIDRLQAMQTVLDEVTAWRSSDGLSFFGGNTHNR